VTVEYVGYCFASLSGGYVTGLLLLWVRRIKEAAT